ncbi:hypothetical protein H0H81_007127 [Sphagnurus paluster]|uniref:Uncharacterized protein n=1 Tax=Sphagnurus paluster TaxID=117069 RepID=A0A9P7FR84_9AGAR|nr:hypothetical protein H0H81_007127 [Sphagnurus paluster]
MITKSGQRSPESEQVAAGPSDASPPPYEAAWENSLNRLQNKVTAYNDVEQQGREPTAAEAQQVADAMQHVGDSHPDPKVKGDWHRRAAKFRNGTRSTRRGAVREHRIPLL